MQSIFKKEITIAIRDKRLLILSALILLLLAVALFSGYNRFAALEINCHPSARCPQLRDNTPST